MDKEMVLDALNEAFSYGEKLIDGCDLLANNFKSDLIDEGLKLITVFTEGVIWFYDVIRLTQEYTSFEFDEEKLLNNLNELCDLIEVKDYYTVAEILQYEFKEQIQMCRENLSLILNA